MAQFDVYRERGGDSLLLDCQADLLSYLDTRFVVPLSAEDPDRGKTGRLNPVFRIGEQDWVMMTQLAAAVPAQALSERVASLDEHRFKITGAIDVLLSGV